MNDQKIDSNKHYSADFYKPTSYKIIEEYFPLIGEITSSFNSLDNLLSEDLIEFINPNDSEIGWIIISGMSFVQKIELWENILLWYIKDDGKLDDEQILIEKLKDLSNNLKEIGIIRNKIVHADWDGMNDKLLVKNKTKTSKKGGVEHYYLTIDKTEFYKRIIQIEVIYDEFSKFNINLIKLLELGES